MTATRPGARGPRGPFRVQWWQGREWRTFNFNLHRSLAIAGDVMMRAAFEHAGTTFRIVDSTGRIWSTTRATAMPVPIGGAR